MCGIYGVIGASDVHSEVVRGIRLLQHRGQEAAGILFVNEATDLHHLYKELGPLEHLAGAIRKHQLPTDGTMGVAHLRYATTTGDTRDEAQPFWTSNGNIGLAQNGQVTNMDALRQQIAAQGKSLVSKSDGELLLRVFAHHYKAAKGTPAERAKAATLATRQEAKGSYALILPIKGVGLLAFRDSNGIRPLAMGRKQGYVAFSSESCALWHNGYADIVDVSPGEGVLVRHDLSVERFALPAGAPAHCGFEYFYFADPDSILDGVSVNHARYRMGKLLAKRMEALLPDIDLVIPVPNSPLPAVDGFCDATGKPLRNLIRKYPLGRIFITPDQAEREFRARQLFRYSTSGGKNPFANNGILLIDDSIVRGTNMRIIIENVRKMGARSVHVAITWPQITSGCPFGVDMERPGEKLLLGRERTVEQIREQLGADSLTFASIEDVHQVLGGTSYCTGCASGKYPEDAVGELVTIGKRNPSC